MRNIVSLFLSVSRRKRRQRKRILIVDEDPALLAGLELVLQAEGYLTHTAENASSLQQQLRWQPDLILLNVWLRETDGRLLSRYLKNQDRTRHIPIVLMTPHSRVVAAFAQSGAQEVLTKPFDLETLLIVIEKYV
jgi:CheY-like chemotaxis protein